jgi:hypothetical protein
MDRNRFLLFALIGGAIMFLLYAVPYYASTYNITYTSQEYTIAGKGDIPAATTGLGAGMTTYYLHMQPSSEGGLSSYSGTRCNVDKEDYNALNIGDTCNVTRRYSDYTEPMVSGITCNGTSLKHWSMERKS